MNVQYTIHQLAQTGPSADGHCLSNHPEFVKVQRNLIAFSHSRDIRLAPLTPSWTGSLDVLTTYGCIPAILVMHIEGPISLRPPCGALLGFTTRIILPRP